MPVCIHTVHPQGRHQSLGRVEIPSFGCRLRLCILKRDPRSWQVRRELCLTLVGKGRSQIQGLSTCVCLHSWGTGSDGAEAKCWRVCLAPSRRVMESSRLRPSSESSLPSICAEHIQSRLWVNGLCSAHVKSVSTRRLLVGKTQTVGLG